MRAYVCELEQMQLVIHEELMFGCEGVQSRASVCSAENSYVVLACQQGADGLTLLLIYTSPLLKECWKSTTREDAGCVGFRPNLVLAADTGSLGSVDTCSLRLRR